MSWHKYRLPVGVLVLVVAVGALVWAMKRPEGSPAKVAASGESTLPTIDADAVTAMRLYDTNWRALASTPSVSAKVGSVP